MQKLNPICASKADFASFLTANEGVVAEAFDKKARFLAATFNKDERIELDSIDSKNAAETLMEFQDRLDTLWSMLPASESIGSKINYIIDKYLRTDRSRMMEHYKREIKEVTTAREAGDLVEDIERDLSWMKKFVSNEITLEKFCDWLIKTDWLIFMGITFGIPGAVAGAITLAIGEEETDKMREKTKTLIPGMEQILKQAKEKYKKLTK